MACVKKGGKRISHPRGDFPPMGGFLTHGLCQEGWERDFPPTGGFLTHGGGSHPWLVSGRVGPGTDGRVSEHKRDFPPTGGHPWGCLLWSVRPVVAALSVPAIASVSAAAGAAVAESAESTVAVDDA